jgi:hypothetical protein
MFVGALFRDSASRVLKHYRGYVDEIEHEAEELARKQMEEEENRMYYTDHREQLEREYEMLLAMNATRKSALNNKRQGVEALVNTWSTGGAQDEVNSTSWQNMIWPFSKRDEDEEARVQRIADRVRQREERRLARKKAKALKEAAKVVVDYRPVMSRIIDDYLFRCPTWHYAHLVSLGRERRGKHKDNVFVYRFSQPTHIPGYKECWGKVCKRKTCVKENVRNVRISAVLHFLGLFFTLVMSHCRVAICVPGNGHNSKQLLYARPHCAKGSSGCTRISVHRHASGVPRCIGVV